MLAHVMFSSTRRTEADEAALLAAFRARVASDVEPGLLRRWLVARDWRLEPAVAMFEASRRFRDETRLDELLAANYRPPEVLRRYLAGGFLGYARDGGPLRLELFGALDLPGLLRSCDWADLQRVKLLECETAERLCAEQGKRLGRPVTGMTVIFDMAGATARFLWPPGVAAYMRLVRMLEDNYPELVSRLLVVNAPAVFPLLYRVCRPLISQAMRDKIAVLSGDPAAVTAALLERIPAEHLPAYLGGERRDVNGDPRCSAEVCQGGRVPPSYYLDTADDTMAGDSSDAEVAS